jgi:hypothetical protein
MTNIEKTYFIIGQLTFAVNKEETRKVYKVTELEKGEIYFKIKNEEDLALNLPLIKIEDQEKYNVLDSADTVIKILEGMQPIIEEKVKEGLGDSLLVSLIEEKKRISEKYNIS